MKKCLFSGRSLLIFFLLFAIPAFSWNPFGDEPIKPAAKKGQTAAPGIQKIPDLPKSAVTPKIKGTALDNWKGGGLAAEKFFALLGPVCREVYRKTGVPASVTLAQACLETDFGEATIGDAKNLFGIKGKGPAGSVTHKTKEYIKGKAIYVNEKFRKYNSWEESIEDHGKFLQNPIYANCMKNSKNPDQFARELQKAGYATDPKYAQQLIARMKYFKLYKWDDLSK